MSDDYKDLEWAKEIARKIMAGGVQWKDVDPEMAEPLADAIVAALAEPLRQSQRVKLLDEWESRINALVPLVTYIEQLEASVKSLKEFSAESHEALQEANERIENLKSLSNAQARLLALVEAGASIEDAALTLGVTAENSRLRRRIDDLEAVLVEIDTPHAVIITNDDWFTEHDIACRRAGLSNCAIHKAMAARPSPPAYPGRYLASIDEYGILKLVAVKP